MGTILELKFSKLLAIKFTLYSSINEQYVSSKIEHIKFMEEKQDQLNILRKLNSNPRSSQRKLAHDLGFSLGKLNYLVKELHKKGLIKIENFKKNPKKINYIYILTPKGISEKTKLTVNFMNRKMREYDELKKELSDLENKK